MVKPRKEVATECTLTWYWVIHDKGEGDAVVVVSEEAGGFGFVETPL